MCIRDSSQFTLNLLDSGKVLVTGGMSQLGGFTDTAELYDPETGTWSYTAPLRTGGFFQASARLYSGEVLVTGYIGGTPNTEVYNPATNSWRTVASIPGARAFQSAVRLYSGQVLVTGGGDGQGNTAATFLYDPFNDVWTRGPDMNQARGQDHFLTLLYSGKVLAANGGTAEVYDPDTNTWTPEPTGPQGSTSPVGALLHTGQVLFANTRTALYTP